MYIKPLPQLTPDSKEFWDGCKRHELLIQRCKGCGTYRHYPRPMCHKCNSMNAEWVRVSGKGKVFSWTVTARAFYPGFEVPYAVVIIELDEGVRMVSNVVDCKPEDLYIGMPVEVVFEDVTKEITLPKFKVIS